MSQRYDTNYEPPIPILAVSFSRLGEDDWLGPFEAVVDSGADATILPSFLVKRLKPASLAQGVLRSQWGDAHPITVYMIDAKVEGRVLPGVVVVADPDAQEIILGRTVINKLPVFLDGPTQYTTVLDDITINRLRSRSSS